MRVETIAVGPTKRRSSWDQAPLPHELGNDKRVVVILDDSSEIVDHNVLTLLDRVPFYSWGGAINMSKPQAIECIKRSNYSTIMAAITHLRNKPTEFWSDNKEKDFDGIGRAMEERLIKIGYIIKTSTRISYNTGNGIQKTLILPQNVTK